MGKGKVVSMFREHHSARDTMDLIYKLLGVDGGPGSGNFNHSGRPGLVGGSAPKEGAESASESKKAPKKPETPDEFDEAITLKLRDLSDARGEAQIVCDEIEDLLHKIPALRNDGEIEEAGKVEKQFHEKQEEYNGLREEISKIKDEIQDLKSGKQEAYEQEEKKEIEASGMTEADWRRSKAVDEFGITDDYEEAGFMLPNGDMLDFGVGTDFEGRNSDHREISSIYINGDDDVNKCLRRFRNDGNIRIYPEIPGINISIAKEPTDEQYQRIIDMVYEFADDQGQFCVDFSDEYGIMIGQLAYVTDPDEVYDHEQYNGENLDPDEIISDIREYFASGDTEEFGRPTFARDRKAMDGGPGSGNHGHSGRPGKVGGSAPKGEAGGSDPGKAKEPSDNYWDLVDPDPDEDFDIFEFLASQASEKEPDLNKEEIRKSPGYAGMARNAQKHKENFAAFRAALTPPEREFISAQRDACGTKESEIDYERRVFEMLTEEPPAPPPEFKIAEGKDITADYSYTGLETGNNKGTEEIDTVIEDVLHKQGFDGIPKVVSKEEFDKMISENPDMPQFFRAYTAESPEALEKYDKDLEEGFFYVDCGEGGAQYGYGMYTAGVYKVEPKNSVMTWDDPGLEFEITDPSPYSPFVFTAPNGDCFKAKQTFPDGYYDLTPGYTYMFANPDRPEKRTLVEVDEDTGMYTNLATGEILDDDDMELLVNGGFTFECKPQDVEVYRQEEKAIAQAENARRMTGAMREMDHYLAVGINRLSTESRPTPPLGKNLAHWFEGETATYHYFDTNGAKSVEEARPEDGDVVAVDMYGVGTGKRKSWEMYRVVGGTLYPLTPGGATYEIADLNGKTQWAPVEGTVPSYSPTGKVRRMALDPSAKIITLDEIREIKQSGKRLQMEAYSEEAQKVQEYLRGKPFELGFVFDVMNGQTIADEHMDMLLKLKKEHPEMIREASEWYKKASEETKEKLKKSEALIRLKDYDIGELAAMLGYDAINAEDHGDSDSYTVILNRTKVILQKEAV